MSQCGITSYDCLRHHLSLRRGKNGSSLNGYKHFPDPKAHILKEIKGIEKKTRGNESKERCNQCVHLFRHS